MYSVTIIACLTAYIHTKKNKLCAWAGPKPAKNCKKDLKETAKLTEVLTFGDHPLEPNDVLVGELAHDGGLAEKVLPLFLCVARLQRLDCHRHLFPPWHL